jgi:hypothetical protein
MQGRARLGDLGRSALVTSDQGTLRVRSIGYVGPALLHEVFTTATVLALGLREFRTLCRCDFGLKSQGPIVHAMKTEREHSACAGSGSWWLASDLGS